MKDFFRSLSRSVSGLCGALIVVAVVLLSLLTPWLSMASPTKNDLRARMAPPTISMQGAGLHPLGADQLGRDIFSRIAHGSRVTLMVAISAVVLGGIVGVAIGIFAGYRGGFWDAFFMRLVEMQLALPLMLLAVMVVAALGPNLFNLVCVLALTCWTRYARIVRGQVLALREREFVLSARAAGASSWRIMLRHILPNVMTPVLVVATLELARVIILEASLSFLGLGIQPPDPSWGRMLAEGRTYLSSGWWVATFPGLAILVTVMGVNLLGDWLRDHFDPRLRN